MPDRPPMRMPRWSWIWPAFAWLMLASAFGFGAAVRPIALLVGIGLIGAVSAAVYHAEVIAHRIGEPFGTLVLAIAVTVIEVSLIVSMMLKGGPGAAGLARDTVFAATMIVCNGIVGLCLLAGGTRYHVQVFQLQGALSALAVLASMTVLTLVIPNMTVTTPGPGLSTAQLEFEGLISLVLYCAFVFVQTVRHRDFFLPPELDTEEHHPWHPTANAMLVSGLLLPVCLVAVVASAKVLSGPVEAAVKAAGASDAVVGIIIAALVLMPEGLASLRAARRDRLQTSMNLALGSVLATIGLTMPTVAVVSILIGQPLTLGLDATNSVLLALTLLVAAITLGTGKTTILQGIVHLSIFAVFLFLTVVP
jgi:Ca2+:H+ antiporter